MAARLPVEFHGLARVDIAECADFIALDSADQAARFVRAVASACDLVSRLPHAGRCANFSVRSIANARHVRVRGFPQHLVFYHLPGRRVEVLAVVHGSRDLPRALAR